MTPEGITSEWLSTVLGEDVVLAGTSRIGDGLVGMNLRLQLQCPAGSSIPSTMVAKLPSPDPTSRATGVALRNYERLSEEIRNDLPLKRTWTLVLEE